MLGPGVLLLLRWSNPLNIDCSVIIISDSLLVVLSGSSGMWSKLSSLNDVLKN